MSLSHLTILILTSRISLSKSLIEYVFLQIMPFQISQESLLLFDNFLICQSSFQREIHYSQYGQQTILSG
ncbi:hypothetical protein FGO68_gene1643 [Halteria grandinella]|uniref:Uncharacterized protein n=1 Tax=Halteria grandinella TaxID=5974 RepID=A0A8J8NWP5_HALGN|nr:hypothetical protein FGO68_gene1643 [Halteria grandinella]